jgi:2-hydroxychromene-2-carboxylate isomerase
MAQIDYFFTVLSPWVYLASDRLERICAARGAAIAYRPVTIAEVFARTGGRPLPQRHPARQAYRLQELRRWSAYTGRPITLHPANWGAGIAEASAAVAAAGARAGPLLEVFACAVWRDDSDLGDPDARAALIRKAGLDPDRLDLAAGAAAVAANTEEAVTRGVFGSPFYLVGEEAFWGQDRLDFLDRHLAALQDAGK